MRGGAGEGPQKWGEPELMAKGSSGRPPSPGPSYAYSGYAVLHPPLPARSYPLVVLSCTHTPCPPGLHPLDAILPALPASSGSPAAGARPPAEPP